MVMKIKLVMKVTAKATRKVAAQVKIKRSTKR